MPRAIVQSAARAAPSVKPAMMMSPGPMVHPTAPSTSSARPTPGQVGSDESMLVTWVIANTKTRSKKSSSGVTRSSRSPREASTRQKLVHDEYVAGRLPHKPRAHGAVDQPPQPAAAADDDDCSPALLRGGTNLRGRVSDRLQGAHLDSVLCEQQPRLPEQPSLPRTFAVVQRLEPRAHRLSRDDVDHAHPAAPADELGGMEKRAPRRLRSVVGNEDPHGRW